jgi:hypothetical protein
MPQRRTIAAARWAHADLQSPASAAELALPAGIGELDLDVDEGDNRSLAIDGALLLVPGVRLRFFHEPGRHLELVYGRNGQALEAPRYDLQLLRPQLVGSAAEELALGPEQVIGGEVTTHGPQTSFFWGALGVAVLALLVVIARLVKREEPPAA